MTRIEWLRKNYGNITILDIREEREFTEFVIARGGDTIVFRVYGTNLSNYRITER